MILQFHFVEHNVQQQLARIIVSAIYLRDVIILFGLVDHVLDHWEFRVKS